MRLLWWMLILSRLSDWTDGFIFIRPERYTGKPAPAAVCGSNTRLQMCTDGLQGFNYTAFVVFVLPYIAIAALAKISFFAEELRDFLQS